MGGVIWPHRNTPKSLRPESVVKKLDAYAEGWEEEYEEAWSAPKRDGKNYENKKPKAVKDGKLKEYDSTEKQKYEASIRAARKAKKPLGPSGTGTPHDIEDKLGLWQAATRTAARWRRLGGLVDLSARALEKDLTGTKYAVIEKPWAKSEVERKGKIYQVIGALLALTEVGSQGNFVDWLTRPEDILDLTLEYFFPSNIFAKNPGFVRKRPLHAIANGHGFCVTTVKPIIVPTGIHLYFYCTHGDVLGQEASQNIEGFVEGHVMAIPVDVYGPGDRVPNYFLAYPGGVFSGLTINVSGHAGGAADLIFNEDPYRMIPLSAILDSMDNEVRHFHWCACRKGMSTKDVKSMGLEFEPDHGPLSQKPYLRVTEAKKKTTSLSKVKLLT